MKKKWIVVLVIVVIVIVARLALPYFVTSYVNKTLRNIEGYTGSVEEVDIRLIRGAYVINQLEILKTGDSISIPFVEVRKIDLSLHWNALLRGSISGEVIMENPIVNFAVAGSKSSKVKQDGAEADWLQTLKELMPLKINRFQVVDGKISFKDFSTEPKVDIFVDSLQLLVTNLSNVEDKSKRLPSMLKATGYSLGGGNINLEMKMNALKKIPDFDLDFSFEDLDLTALNDFVKAYTNTDIERGTFNLYTEMTADNGKLEGYVKPVIQNLQVLDWNKEKGGFLQKVWESIVGAVSEILENQQKDQLATKTPVSGDLNNLDVGVWPTIWNIFENAFIEALSRKIDGTVDFSTGNTGEQD
ncbi:DUF748 domain-containing protein [uncultured Sunxiuqinia sp.]|uniref:DUF748 domain-containing protein n=1 Tax=uncultured Sunxiuqinia sp. TaxID=1573825 RepID=UPI002AA85558|nr:DUF748 domain-containing protein [uncultured Sunxiuqinia sp.]